jgi:serine/threonine protein kinase
MVFDKEGLMSFTPGENVGSYRIIEKLGQGGMATVFKAYHPALDRYVAIKVLHPAFKEDPQFLQRFAREARVVARLEHSNIVPIYDFAEHNGQPYLVMKYIEGETLKARLQRSPLKKDEALKTIMAVGAALNYAHGKGVLHRDVKPSNIMIAMDGEVYLTDFGLARMAEAGASTLTGDMLMGTPQYISPEQASGEKNLTACTDIYSFGIVLYEIVVGRVPFNADTPFSIIHDHIYTPLPLPSEVNPKVPLNIQQVLLKALAKNPEDRYQSGKELVDAFLAVMKEKVESVVLPAEKPDEKSVEEEKAKPEAENEQIIPTPPITATSTDVPVEKAPSSMVQKSGRKWVWIGAGIIMTCITLFAFVAIANQSGIRTLFNQKNDVVEESAEPTAVSTFSKVEQAEKVVNERPNDPAAHLNLAEAYRSEGMNPNAADQYLEAGLMFVDQKRFLEAVKALNEAIYLQGGPRAADPGILERVVQILFTSAPDESFTPIYQQTADMFPAWDIPKICEARSYLYQDRMDRAQVILEGILGSDPDNIYASSVKTELTFLRGMNEEALTQVKLLRNRQGLPDWLSEYLQNLEQEIRTKMER